MKFTRSRYQNGCLSREGRKSGPDVWIFRYREATPDGRVNRKFVVGTLNDFHTKAAAQKAVESLRININNERWKPSTVAQLVTHYLEKEIQGKTPYTVSVYRAYLETWILPEWGERVLADVKA